MANGVDTSGNGESGGSQIEVAWKLSHVARRRWIGYLGLFLPLLLYSLAELRTTPDLPRGQVLDSVSAYYYSGSIAVFVGVLFALSLFLVTYRGYTESIADRVLGALGGITALCVALFPTGAPNGLEEPAWWSETTRTIHYVSAVLLFVIFIAFALWLFPKSNVPKSRFTREKRWQNRIYRASGVVMIGAVLWAASSLVTDAPIFWPESIALSAFAVSWLAKGRAYAPVLRNEK